jgi:4-hydroxy-tetrahydrodipicolinate reductase
MLIKTITEDPRTELAVASERAGSALVGQDAGTLSGGGELGVIVADREDTVFASDVVIEFTLPEVTLVHARAAAAAGTPIVIGTTGLNSDQEAELTALGKTVPIVYAPNMSVGVNLLLALVERVSAALGPDAWDIEIVEMHHNRKIDAPSGTAIGLGRAAAMGRERSFDEVAVLSREGQTGARRAGDIGFATLRGGDVVGEHTVVFAGDAERIELTHKAGDRRIFANGAVQAACWVAGKPAGLYSMRDVLNL